MIAALLPLLVLAAPAVRAITGEAVVTIVPGSVKCADPNNKECRDAWQVAPALTAGFKKWGISSYNAQAAILSLEAFESGDFRYKTNHFPAPGRPGQGTANMQMANYNQMYLKAIPELASVDASDTKAMMAALTDDKYNFASGAWFWATQCSDDVKNLIDSDPDAGWTKYLTECVGTTDTPERRKYWDAAKDIFKNYPDPSRTEVSPDDAVSPPASSTDVSPPEVPPTDVSSSSCRSRKRKRTFKA